MKVLRLIEHEPAWELHILLRIVGLAYTTDYSPTPFALGRPLPILVDDSTIYSGEGCFRYLSKQCPYYPNIEAADELITSYLQKHLIQVYENFLVLNKDNYKNLLRNDSFGVRTQQSFLLDLQSIIPSFQKKHLLFPDYNADQLRLKLLQTFSSLNDKLVDWDENSILSSWSDDYQFVSDQYGIADALLYGQIVRFLTNEEFSTLISSHEQIMKYFEHLNNRYFVSIDIHDSIEPYWNVSLQVLLNNPYNRYNPDAEDIIEALQLPELDVVDHLQLRDIWTEDLPTIYTSPFRVTDSSTLSSTSERLTAPMVTPKKGIAEEEEELPSPNSQSPVSKYLSSKKWIFTATFNLAVGASFIGYIIQTMNHR